MSLALDLPAGSADRRPATPSGRVRRPWSALLRHGRALLGVAATGVLLAVVLPAIAGSPWSAIVGTLTAVPVPALVGLVALWAAGLALHMIVLTAALPGLSARRAATLSLTGSAVANVLPAGGAAGVALNFRMARTWGFDPRQIWRYTVVTNVWDVLAKVALPVVVLPLLVASGVGLSALVPTAVVAAVGALALAAACSVLLSPSVARTAGRLVDRLVDRLVGGLAERVGRVARVARVDRVGSVSRGTRGAHRTSPDRWEQRLAELQRATGELVRQRWGRLTLGMALYTAALLALMLACFAVTGAGLPVGVVLCAFVLERLLTLAGLTPGGAGLVEVGVTGLLVGLGAAAGTAVAGILLYRGLTMALEVPVGGAWLLGWLSLHLRDRRRVTHRPGTTATADADPGLAGGVR